jgi:uncharacterized membrane protein YraQ (UPF0718 family)/copper chaperone CopZ
MMEWLLTFLAASWSVFGAMAPYLLLGFFVAGLLSVVISPDWVERHLGGNGLGQVVKASLFGVPLPLCSCGVIPVAASLHRHGAGKGATTAFLLSTPQTGVDSIAVTYALLGPFLAVVRPVAAFATGIFGGGLVQAFNGDGAAVEESADEAAREGCCSSAACDDQETAKPSKILEALHYGLVVLPRDIGKALIYGVLISGLIAAVVEPRALESALGGGLLPMLAAMAIGIPLYVCATASTPIALGLIHAGLSPGAALVFLISGPATNSAALTTLWKVLGRRAAILYLVTVAVASLATGFAIDGLISAGSLPESALVPAASAVQETAGHVHGESVGGAGSWYETVSAVALLLVLVNALRPRRRAEEEGVVAEDNEQTVELKIDGMRCNGCVTSLQRALSEITGVTGAEVWLEEGRARIRGRELSVPKLIDAVTSLGFKAQSTT